MNHDYYFNGVLPTKNMRIVNERASLLLEPVVRLVMIRTEKNQEGVTYYRMYDVPLERDRSPALSRSWTVLHHITDDSPLLGATPDSTVRDEVELILTLSGTDELSAQLLH